MRQKRHHLLAARMKVLEEEARRGDRGGLVRKLESLNKSKRPALGGDRESMRDADGRVYEGAQLRKKWRETFERVGRLLEEAGGFDESFKAEVEREVEEWSKDRAAFATDDEIEQEVGKEKRRVGVDAAIERWEVGRALRRLRAGKAVGVDAVVAELLKHGGEWMEESVWELCVAVFEGEQLPIEWLRAVKVPVRKTGTGGDFEHYRGVTLLSVVGKVFAMVVEARLRAFAESRGLLSDSQFGFRQGRACRDALLVLSEVVERRGAGKVYAAFLDIAKAYPSVWRAGLWRKLLTVGVRGRLWRVLRSLYFRCEVGVRVQGEVTDWYEEFVGVREGCVVSPILFALYINGLSEELEQRGGEGVRVGPTRVLCLLFADDVVILDSSKEGLQASLDVAWEYSRRWRFEYNFGKDKSAVVVFGGAGKAAREAARARVEESRKKASTARAAAKAAEEGAAATAATAKSAAEAAMQVSASAMVTGRGSEQAAVAVATALLEAGRADEAARVAAQAIAASTEADRAVEAALDTAGGEWQLGSRRLEIVDDYKYLGVRFAHLGGWKISRGELLAKARGGFWKAWGLGMGAGALSVGGAAALWTTIVQSVLEYGGEVDSGRWEEAEQLQRMAGRMVLGVGTGVANEVVRGELGWWSIQARRQYARLVYWGRMVRREVPIVVQAVYTEGRRRVQVGTAGAREWCAQTKAILEELGLGEEWDKEEVGTDDEWRRTAREMMQHKEERRWREGMLTGGREGGPKVKLERYMRIKTSLRREWYGGEDRVWVRRWVKLRAGVEELEVEMGRRKGTIREARRCGFCSLGEVEDEDHFLERCGRWSEERAEVWRRIRDRDERAWKKASSWPSSTRTDWVLGGGPGGRRAKAGVMRAVVGMLFARNRALKIAGDSIRSRSEREQRWRDRERRREMRAALHTVQQATARAEIAIEAIGGVIEVERARREEAVKAAVQAATAAALMAR